LSDPEGSNGKGGRPTKGEQAKMQQIFRKYFDRGISATATASQTGHNVKTVCEYFEEWSEQIIELEKKDYLEQHKLDRVQIISSFDTQLIEAYKFADEISNQITLAKKKKGGIAPRYLLEINLDVNKFISSLIEKKGNFVMSPVIDQALKDMVNGMIRKNG
jgi:hypothetical protein